MGVVLVRKGCAGYVEGAVGVSKQRMCGRCGMNRGIHRRWRVLDGGKHEEGTMPATSEASEIASERRRMSVALAAKVLHLADEGATLWLTIRDPQQWESVKAMVQPARVRLTGSWDRVCETFVAPVGDFMVTASGPTWTPSREDFNRMLDEREEG
jgi:hypothetical protein